VDAVWRAFAWLILVFVGQACRCGTHHTARDAGDLDAAEDGGSIPDGDAAGGADADVMDSGPVIEDASADDGGDAAGDAAVAPDGDAAAPTELRLHGLSCGLRHCCAIDEADALRCWGDDSRGQSSPPAGRFLAVAGGDTHSCAIALDGRVHCFGEPGLAATDPPEGAFVAIAAGRQHACALDPDGRAQCWGDDTYGQLTEPLEALTTLSARGGSTCGLTEESVVTCWGLVDDWIVPATEATGVVVGHGLACAIDPVSGATCFGATFEAPWESVPNVAIASLALGGFHGCTLQANGTLTCFGSGTENGGDCEGPDFFCGQAAVPPGRYREVAAGRIHTCAIRADGTPICFGNDAFGQLSSPR
jgi:alpha-tubulin suppressor-like RCC1 family protein